MRVTFFVLVCALVAGTIAVFAGPVLISVPDGELTAISTTLNDVGRRMSPGEQCRGIHSNYIGVCQNEGPEHRCAELMCADVIYGIPVPMPSGPAFDGTWCGDGMICQKGSCVTDPQPPESPININDTLHDCDAWWRDMPEDIELMA